MFLFFFQAEDGIRDLYVTGVQTCALPIYVPKAETDRFCRLAAAMNAKLEELGNPFVRHFKVLSREAALIEIQAQIGRASCREKSVDLGGRGIIKEKKIKI